MKIPQELVVVMFVGGVIVFFLFTLFGIKHPRFYYAIYFYKQFIFRLVHMQNVKRVKFSYLPALAFPDKGKNVFLIHCISD